MKNIKMNLLFICKHNRFRSKIAESYFNKINKNKKIKVKSAGIIKGSYPLDKEEVDIAKKLGIKLKGKPQGISTNLLRLQNLIILVADDVPISLFNYSFIKNKIITWKITDETKGNKKNIEKIIKFIMKKTEALVEKLKDKK